MYKEFSGHYVYILECADGTLYTGWSTDIKNRVRTHNSGKGAKYTKSRRPVSLVYCEKYDTKSEALKRERSIKNMSRSLKLELIRSSSVKYNDF
ncbi:MAG TPA: GIY-YIG nuclease family protein [Bacillota bacterium]|nr:GIY-YIG nuclease family protein [Bacillota bacterium]HUM55882.1 GIY-YIG nuclease family protein [Bacillota bacterium]